MDANKLACAVTALAISISNTHSIKDIQILSAIFVQLGDTLALIATQRESPE